MNSSAVVTVSTIASYSDIRSRLKTLREQGVYRGPLTGTKDQLAAALFLIDGCLPTQSTALRRTKPINLPIAFGGLPDDLVVCELLPLLDWPDLFSFLSVSRYCARYRNDKRLWKERLDRYNDDELQELGLLASRANNRELVRIIDSLKRLERLDDCTTEEMAYHYLKRATSGAADDVLEIARVLRHHPNMEGKKLLALVCEIEKLSSFEGDIMTLSRKLDEILSSSRWLFRASLVGRLVAQHLTIDHVPAIKLLKSRKISQIVYGLVQLGKADLLNLLDITDQKNYDVVIGYGSRALIEQLGLLKKAKKAYTIGDRELWLQRYTRVRTSEGIRYLLLRHAYLCLSVQETVEKIDALQSNTKHILSDKIGQYAEDAGKTRWAAAFRDAVRKRYEKIEQ